jgi:hypothetical protein
MMDHIEKMGVSHPLSMMVLGSGLTKAKTIARIQELVRSFPEAGEKMEQYTGIYYTGWMMPETDPIDAELMEIH